MSGYVYVVGNSVASKIGYSKSPLTRVQSVESSRFDGAKCDSFISEYSDMARAWEAKVHVELNDKLIGNEMFAVSFDGAVEAIMSHEPSIVDIAKKGEFIKGLAVDKLNAVDMINNVETMRVNGVVMGNMTQFWGALNVARVDSGKSNANLTNFLNSKRTQEFARMAARKNCYETIVITGNGNTSRTWVDLTLLVYAAEQVSARFHLQVINAFIDGTINNYQNALPDTSTFVSSNLSEQLSLVEGSDEMEVSSLILASVNSNLAHWKEADNDDLERKSKMEKSLASMIRCKLVKGYEHLKLIIEDIK